MIRKTGSEWGKGKSLRYGNTSSTAPQAWGLPTLLRKLTLNRLLLVHEELILTYGGGLGHCKFKHRETVRAMLHVKF